MQNTNWRPVRWLVYGESTERMRSMISTSVPYNPVEGSETIKIIIVRPYRCSLLIMYQSTLEQKLTVPAEDSRG